MNYEYEESFVSRRYRFELGTERTTGSRYIGVMTDRSAGEWLVHYRLSQNVFDELMSDVGKGAAFAKECLMGHHKDLVMDRREQPGP
ncbi:MAG: hypothetical protein LLG14_16810 [Nocardiaceae bacterium]|nr:hypothetical protein [Nocardiaceae bacterium]